MSRYSVGVVAVTVTALLWGTTGTAATFAPTAGPLAIGSAALGIGGILQALIAIGPLWCARAELGAHRGLILLGAIGVAAYPLAFYSSMHLAGVAIGSVVSLASAPLASGLLERFVERKRLSRAWMWAATLGIVGSAMLSMGKAAGGGDVGATLLGIGLGLVAGLTYATYSWVAQRLMGEGMPRAAAMGAVFGAGGILLLPVLLITGAPLIASAEAFSVAAYMAIVPMFLGYVLFGIGLSRIPASTATTITLIEPAAATVLAVIVVGETLGPIGWGGMALLGTAIAVLALMPARGRTRSRH